MKRRGSRGSKIKHNQSTKSEFHTENQTQEMKSGAPLIHKTWADRLNTIKMQELCKELLRTTDANIPRILKEIAHAEKEEAQQKPVPSWASVARAGMFKDTAAPHATTKPVTTILPPRPIGT